MASPGSADAIAGEELHTAKRRLKHLMRQWELEYEEANGGLVATHEDKKRDPRYGELKAEAKRLESSLKHMSFSRKELSRSRLGSSSSSSDLKVRMPPYDPSKTMGITRFPSNTGTEGGTRAANEVHYPTEARFAFDGGRISLSPFHVTLLLLACAIPYAAFISGFSLMGFGAMVYDYLVSNGKFFYPTTLSATGILLVLYLFDVSYWVHPASVVARRVTLSVSGFMVLLGACLASREYPYGPMLLLFFIAPLFWWLLYAKFLWTWPLSDFLRALSFALLLLSVGAGAIWIAWVLNGNNWNIPNKRRYMLHMRCCTDVASLPQMLYTAGYVPAQVLIGNTSDEMLEQLNFTEAVATSSIWDGLRWPTSSANVSLVGTPALPSLEPAALAGRFASPRLLVGAAVDESGCLVLPTSPCLSVLIFWISPFVTAAAGLVAMFIATLLARTFRHEGDSAQGGGVSQGGRVFIMGVVLAAACLWVSASVAGASMGVSRVVTSGVFSLVIVMTVLIDRLFGWRTILTAITKEPLVRRLVRFCITSDWSRAMVVSITSPMLMLVVVLSVGNQFIRVRLLRSVVMPDERALWTTEIVARTLNRVVQWNWTSVLRKVIVLCVFYMVWVVGVMKVTVFFFSWLSYELSKVSLAISTGVFIGVGMCMFLLPPVPGAPVYMASGVLLTAVAEPTFGYWGAAGYAIGVAYCIKLTACALQQKLIGGTMRRSVTIRSACQINSPLMRAIKLMMADKSIYTRGKVATLVGGPDWPTSVMMGLMGLRVAPMVLGTLPVIFLVAPLSLSGSFMIMGDQSPFPALTNIALALSSLSQVGAFVAMLHFVEQATQAQREELERMPFDEEVLALDQRGEEYAALYAEITHWSSSDVPRAMRVLLFVGAVSGIGACQFATLRGSHCFRDFKLYPDFPTQLRENLGGQISNLVKMPGYAVLAATLVAWLCRYLFHRWASRLVRKRYAKGQRPIAFTRKARGFAADEADPTQQPRTFSAEAQAAAQARQRQAMAASQPQSAVAHSSIDELPEKPEWQIQYENKMAAEAQRKQEEAAAAAAAAASGREASASAPHASDERSNSALASHPSKERPGRESRQHRSKERSKGRSAASSSSASAIPMSALEA